MKRSSLLLLLFSMLITSIASAQIVNEPIGMFTRGLVLKKDVYVKCEIEMTQEQLLKLFLKDPNMDKYTKPLAINYMIGKVLSSSAGVLIALPVFESLQDNGSPNWNLAYIGAGCLAASIPFKIAFKKKARLAVAYYNSGYREKDGLSFRFEPGPQSARLMVNF